VEPVPETTQALALLLGYGDELDAELHELSVAVLQIVPDCVGMSLGLLREGLTFTLVASDSEVARLDALQYLAEGREPDSAPTEEGLPSVPSAGEPAVPGVRSTLSLPIIDGTEVVASLNLYASTVDAFDGRTAELARAVGGLESGIVANADLSFSTRLSAAATPVRLEDQGIVERAADLLAGRLQMDVDAAAARLREAAARAGINVVQLARALWRLAPVEHRGGPG
jgi:GAF domain-containing protein